MLLALAVLALLDIMLCVREPVASPTWGSIPGARGLLCALLLSYQKAQCLQRGRQIGGTFFPLTPRGRSCINLGVFGSSKSDPKKAPKEDSQRRHPIDPSTPRPLGNSE